jgi:DNA polymerase
MNDARLQRILRQHVMTDRLLGVQSVPVGEAQIIEEPAEPPPAAPVIAPASNVMFGVRERSSPPAPSPAPPPARRSDHAPMPDRDTKLRILTDMDRNEVAGCVKCELCRGRTRTVFGEGDPDADLMFVGEGPGQTEDEQGRPFVGRAGAKLNEMIKAMGLEREQVYIANVVKCRPPNNRAPLPQEVDACWDYLRRQIETIRPRVIVTLGGPATKLLVNPKEGITRTRGTWHQWTGLLPHGPAIPVMPTFHPAYLLRAYTVENRKKVWSDLQAVMKVLDEKE